MIVPDLIEPFVGWRVWRVLPARRSLELASLYLDVRWPPMMAVGMQPCYLTGLSVPCPPDHCDHRHACGIHASKSLELATRYLPERLRERRFEPVPVLPTTGLVYGKVGLWGEVEEAELSYRAEWAYPAMIVVPVSFEVAGFDARAAAACLAGEYGVPVELACTVAEAAA